MLAITILENQAMEEALIAKVNNSFQSFSTEIHKVGFGDAGYYIIESAARGVGAGAGELADAMREAARKAIQAMRDELEMNSPSKKAIEIGQIFGESVAIGLCASYGEIEGASRLLSSGMNVGAGYGAAAAAQAGMNRLGNLFPSGDGESGGHRGAPFEAMKRMETAVSPYSGGSVALTYSPSYTINGGCSDAAGIKRMAQETSQEGYSDMEELVRNIVRDIGRQELMLSNG